MFADTVRNLLHTPDELRPEHQHIHLGQIHAILNLLCRITEIQRHSQRACLQYPKINRQPLQAIHQKNRHFIPLFNPPLQQKIRKTVGFLVENIPGNLPPVIRRAYRLNQFILLPGHTSSLRHLRINLHQTYVIPVQPAVLL